MTLVVTPDAIIRHLLMSETANEPDVPPATAKAAGAMDILQIQAILPHRTPFF